MYLNGNLVGSEQLSNSENLFSLGTGNDNSKILGKRSSLTPFSREFHGFIDEFHIWDKPLSNNEIQEYMMCNPSGNEEGLIAYWSFNEGSGDTAYDLSGNGNHGVIYDVAYSEHVPEETCSLIIDQLNQSFDAWNISIDLSSGWNMFGYGCPSSIDVADGLSNHTANIIITKDNSGSVYMPEFGFNGIEEFTPGFGYQIKLTEPIEGFSLCDWYVNDIPEDNIVSLQEEVQNLQEENINLSDSLSIVSFKIGCTDSLACNYGLDKIYDDGSCEYPNQGFDCDGVLLPKTLFFFHGGAGGIPFVSDLTASNAIHYISIWEEITTSDLGIAFGEMIENSPSPYLQENATGPWPIIGSMTFGENETITNSSQQWEYFSTENGDWAGSEPYYLVVPNNESFPEDMVATPLIFNLGNGAGVTMASQKDFTWNGDAYTLYKLPLSNSTAAQNYMFLGGCQ